jgi:hypothetical protein
MPSPTPDIPAMTIYQLGVTVGDGPYAMTFALVNGGGDSLRLIDARMPHAVLHAGTTDLVEAPALAGGEATQITFEVTYQPRENASEPSNPFIILRLAWRGDEWRVLAQLAVAHDERGAPTTTTAVMTAHRVGFSVSSS